MHGVQRHHLGIGRLQLLDLFQTNLAIEFTRRPYFKRGVIFKLRD